MNWNNVALSIPFEAPGTDDGGNYAPAETQLVHVATDGVTVTFTLPDGKRWACDREPLQAVVRDPLASLLDGG